jgi:hypothetical protein
MPCEVFMLVKINMWSYRLRYHAVSKDGGDNLVEEMLEALKAMGPQRQNKFSSLTLKLLVSNLSTVSNEDGVGFYKDMDWRENFYHTRWNSNMLADYSHPLTESF